MRPVTAEARPCPSHDPQRISRRDFLPYVDADRSQMPVDRVDRLLPPQVPYDHLFPIIGDFLIRIDPDHLSLCRGPHDIRRLSPRIPMQGPDIDPLVKMLKNPRGLRFRGPDKTEHSRNQATTDRGLKKTAVLILKQSVILRRQLPGNPLARPQEVQGTQPHHSPA